MKVPSRKSNKAKRRFFEARASKIFNPGWEHGRYADFWSFIHFFTGLILASLALFIGLSLFESFLVSFVLAVLYECFEALLGVSEDLQNVVTDVVLVTVPAPIAFSLFPIIGVAGQNLIFLALALCAVNAFLFREGWNGYLKNEIRKR